MTMVKYSSRQSKIQSLAGNRKFEARDVWADAASRYASTTNDDLSTDSETSNLHSETSLEGEDIRTISLAYSEDDSSSRSGTLSNGRSSYTSKLNPTCLLPLPQPLFVNVDMVGNHKIKYTDSSSLTSSECETKTSFDTSMIADRYFTPMEPDTKSQLFGLQSIGSNHSSDSESEHYIFTDDDDDRQSCSASLMYEDVRISNDIGDLNRMYHEAADNVSNLPSEIHERDWSSFHERRGRLLAQRLLEQVTRKTEASSNSSEYGKDENERDMKSQSSFFSRAFRSLKRRVAKSKLYLLSGTLRSNGKRAQEAPQKKMNSTDGSHVLDRKNLSEFESWERIVNNKLHPFRERTNCTSLGIDKTMSMSSLDSSVMESVTPNFLSSFDHFDSVFSPFVLKDNMSDEENDAFDELIVFQSEMDQSAATSELVASALGVTKESKPLLRDIRRNLG